MRDKPDRQTLLEVQEAIGLPSAALVEKDWHVVQALAALKDAASDGLSLVFGGGTALGRAYGLLDRMSEDIDLRIVGEQSAHRSSLKRFRGQVKDALEARGFDLEKARIGVKQGDRYVRLDLPYAPILQGEGVLRPEIKIELAAFPLRRPAVERSVRSFVNEAYDRDPEIKAISCVPLVETAAEKFVALTRRAGAIFGGHDQMDGTLVRHIYDLSRLEGHYDPADGVALALETMAEDATSRGYPAYQEDPLGETLRTVEAMSSSDAVSASYDALINDMVYGEAMPFSEAMAIVGRIGSRLAERDT